VRCIEGSRNRFRALCFTHRIEGSSSATLLARRWILAPDQCSGSSGPWNVSRSSFRGSRRCTDSVRRLAWRGLMGALSSYASRVSVRGGYRSRFLFHSGNCRKSSVNVKGTYYANAILYNRFVAFFVAFLSFTV